MAATNKSKKKTAAPAARTRTSANGRRRKRPKPDINAKWSILLFGIGALFCALVFVPGAYAWNWIRQNILFGVFGIGSFLLAPALIYFAVIVACERPFWGKLAKALLVLVVLCGIFLIFSDIDLTGLSFLEGLTCLRAEAADSPWGRGGGMLSAVFGWTLLALCGRPAANILIIILLAVALMLATGFTPGDAWSFFENRPRREKPRKTPAPARESAVRGQRQEKPIYEPTPFVVDEEPADAGHDRRRIDIPVAAETTTKKKLKDEKKPIIGPGGTFGMFTRQQKNTPVPEPAPPETAAEWEASDAPPDMEAPSSAVPWSEPQPAAPPRPASPKAEQAAAKPSASAPSEGLTALESLVRKASAAKPEPPAEPSSAAMETKQSEAGYLYPPLSLFRKQPPADEQGVEQELTHNADLLVKTLASFGVQTRMMDISRGPTVTRYELQPLAGVKISRITNLADDIALNLATAGVRMEAPIPGKAAVGIEVPNRCKTSVSIRSILESPEFSKSTSPLTFALGKDIAGASKVADLAKMPHILIAGSTGSGKSVCINAIVMSFLYKSSPEDLKLIMIDPKVVELAEYNGIPHLLMPVVTEPRKAAGALGAAVAEMERRYHLFAETNVRDIKSYNRMAAASAGVEKLPYIAIVIDELADLMMVAGKEVEDYICRIAQKARAAGMHLIIATQRPSVDVITGLIKANVPSRIAFAVSSQIDSRTILDSGGAEKLLGMGDMLFMPVGASKPVRIQGTYVRDEEISGVLDFIKQHSASAYSEEMIAEAEKRASTEKGSGGDDSGDDSDSHDPMLKSAVEVVIEAGQASTSLLQRRCKLGYARAARIMDEMEQMHIIGPYEGAKPRQVLISRQQWIEMTMQQDSGAQEA